MAPRRFPGYDEAVSGHRKQLWSTRDSTGYRVSNSGIRKQYIQLALLGRDRLIEPVKVIWVRNVPFHGGDV